jgi:DNA-binding FrmR family transcriptional regulator
MYPDHTEQISRLNKIEGQIKGIRKMIEERRYCLDIISQIKAVTSALKKIELGILESHIGHCVHDAITAKDSKSADTKINEIMKLLGKMP